MIAADVSGLVDAHSESVAVTGSADTQFRLPRFVCPLPQCLAASCSWASSAQLLHHLEREHLQLGQELPSQLLEALGRWVCQRCRVFVPIGSMCRLCAQFEPELPQVDEPMAPKLSLEEAMSVLKKSPPVIRHIPKGAEDAVSEKLAALLLKATETRSIHDVAALQLFFANCLSPLERGGRKHGVQASRTIRQRVESWHCAAVPVEALVEEENARKSRKKRPATTTMAKDGMDNDCQRRVLSAIQDRSLSKACQILQTAHLPPPSNAEASLRSLHPEGHAIAPEAFPPPTGSFDFSASEIESALKSFPAGSSGGPSGLRAAHILQMVRSNAKDRVLEALASFCSALANNSFPKDAMQLLTVARLVAVPKSGGGVRPIAVGEVLRRLAAKCVLQTVLPAVSNYLLPLQVGVHVPNAAELVARRAKAWCNTPGPGEVVLQIDLRNAFNSLDRSQLLKEVQTRVPQLYPYTFACYSEPSILFGDGFELKSSSGVQQGDVCGPALFAITLQKVLLRLQELDLTFQHWYLDDGVLCGPVSEVSKAVSILETALAQLGLQINPQKSRLLCSADVVLPSNLQLIPRATPADGSVFLGVPVGGDEFVNKFCDAAAAKLEEMLRRNSSLDCALGKFLILRACFGACRINHLLRSLDFAKGFHLASKVSVSFRRALEEILGSAISDDQYALACMASSSGGLGLQDPLNVHGPAFLASCFNYAASAERVPPNFWLELGEAWNTLRVRCGLRVNFLADFNPLEASDVSDIDSKWSLQRWWQAQFAQSLELGWRSRVPLRMRKLKELSSARSAYDVNTLVVSDSGKTLLSSRAWILLARFRLAMTLDAQEDRCCPGCTRPMDPFGDHALCCSSLGLYARHNDLRDEFASLCTEAGLSVEVEKGPGLLRPADVLVHGLGAPLAVDFAVVHPLQPSANLAEVHPGKLARQTETTKVRMRMPACRQVSWSFCPFVAETVGRWGGKGQHLLQDVMRRWSLAHHCCMKEAAVACRTRLHASLIRSLARQLERGFPAADAAVVGREAADLYSF